MRTFFVLVSLLTALGTCAQQISLGDSLRDALRETPKLTGKLDGRISLLEGVPARVQGVKVGLSFKKRVEVGLSYNWLATEHLTTKVDEASQLLRFRYIAPYVQYRYVYKKRWRISIPVQIGFGATHFVAAPGGRKADRSARGFVLLYEPSMHVDYLFRKYFNVGAGLGLRLMLINNPNMDQRLTAPTLAFHFGLDIGQLWADIEAGR